MGLVSAGDAAAKSRRQLAAAECGGRVPQDSRGHGVCAAAFALAGSIRLVRYGRQVGASLPHATGAGSGGTGSVGGGFHFPAPFARQWFRADGIGYFNLRPVRMARHVWLAGETALFARTGLCAGYRRPGATAADRTAPALRPGRRSGRLDWKRGGRVDARKRSRPSTGSGAAGWGAPGDCRDA